jgi:hypothetical protein
MLEILQNPASDANNNGVLDSCEGGCTNIADCGDMDDNGVRDNPCLWYQCAAGNCQSMARTTQADLGGPTGACVIDGVGDANDRFHGLNCFSNVTTSGAPGYPCEDDPPAAVNVDAGGPATCVPDGVCDANEAFHALNNFSNVNFIGQAGYPCVCGGPAPAGPATGAQVAPAPAAWTGLTLEAPRRVRPGERLEVDVFLDDAVAALRGYQLHLGTSGGTSGALQLMDIVIREPSVFSPAAEGDLGERRATSDERPYWSAFNIGTQQMLAGLDAVEGVPAAGGAYLATFIYRVSTDAAGTFAVEVLHAPPGQDGSRRTFLFGHAARPIGIREVAPATVTVLKPRAR